MVGKGGSRIPDVAAYRRGRLLRPVRTGFGPSRLRSLTWMDPVSDLPSVLSPFPRLWGLRPAVVRFSARRRPSPTRSFRPSGSQPDQRARDRSIRIVSGVWFDAWNLLVQEGLTAFGLDRSMLSGWIADLERTRCDLGRLIRRLRESGGQWRSRRCAASDERSGPERKGGHLTAFSRAPHRGPVGKGAPARARMPQGPSRGRDRRLRLHP